MKGLTAEEVQERIQEGKVNVNDHPVTRTYKQIIRDNTLTFFNFLNIVLFVMVILVGSFKNSLFIMVIVINTVIGIVQEVRAKKVIDELAIMTQAKAVVYRDGKKWSIATDKLVLDDVILLQNGDQVPADCELLEGSLEVNESLLTGESDNVEKKAGEELFSGSFVTSGEAFCRVIRVGADNYASRITSEAKEYRRHNSELRNSLNAILKFISIIIVPTGALLFYKQRFIVGDNLRNSVVSMAAAVLGMIPEGLILLTSVTLTIGAVTLAMRKTLVQELYCIETLAKVDTLCLDKTGTITEGTMEVEQVIPYGPAEEGSEAEGMPGEVSYGESEPRVNTAAAYEASQSGANTAAYSPSQVGANATVHSSISRPEAHMQAADTAAYGIPLAGANKIAAPNSALQPETYFEGADTAAYGIPLAGANKIAAPNSTSQPEAHMQAANLAANSAPPASASTSPAAAGLTPEDTAAPAASVPETVGATPTAPAPETPFQAVPAPEAPFQAAPAPEAPFQAVPAPETPFQAAPAASTDSLPPVDTQEIFHIMGNIMAVSRDRNATAEALREHFTVYHDYKDGRPIDFSSDRKYSGAVFPEKGTYLIGAAGFLFPEGYENIKEMARTYAVNGLRVLVLAHSNRFAEGSEIPEGLEPISLIVLTDVIREEAPQTMEYFLEQGVNLKVISGDDPATVSAIAKRAGVPNAEAFVDATTITTPEEMKNAVETYSVFGRVTPQQKKEMVLALKEGGHTVAMTGDGVNDVLALKEADCSIAMAAGSDAAKNVAKIVLLDSNFASMPHVVNQGRRVVNNIRTAASMFLIKTIFSVMLSLITIFWGDMYPFEPIQMSLISACAVGIPTFLLSQENNYNKVDHTFLRHVFMNAVPAALTITGCVFTIMLVCQHTYHTTEMLGTACFLVTGWNYMAALRTVYAPLNKFRIGIIYTMQLVFFLAAVIAQNLLSLKSLEFGMIILVFVLMTFSPLLITIITEQIQNTYEKILVSPDKKWYHILVEKLGKS